MCELGWTAFILGKVEPWPRAGIVIDTGKRKVKSKLREKKIEREIVEEGCGSMRVER